MSKNLKIILGTIYLVILISFLYFLYLKFDISRIDDFSYYQSIQTNIEEGISDKLIINLILFFIFSLNNFNIAYSISPDVFIQSTVNRASKVLSEDIPKNKKMDKLKIIAKETVDIRGIGFYSLGKERINLNNSQIETYSKLFEKYFLKSFSSRLAEYSNPEIEVISKNKLNKNYTIVLSKLVATDSRPEVKIEWRVYTKDPDNLLIRDLIIEGLSLARTQKEEFNSIINSNDGNIEALLKSLTKFSSQ